MSYLVKTNGFYEDLLSSIEWLKSIIEIILFYPRSTIWRCPYFNRVYRHQEIADSVTQTKNDVRDREQSDNRIVGERC